MSLPWVRLDTSIGDNPKFLMLMADKRHRAGLAYILGLTYSGRHELDGFIPTGALPMLHAVKADGDALVAAGLWEVTEGGWLVNGWAEFQISGEQAQKRREKAQKAAIKRWHGDGK